VGLSEKREGEMFEGIGIAVVEDARDYERI